jgi:MOSC domain-containing protein YiiM/ferredoxin-NADP reductase
MPHPKRARLEGIFVGRSASLGPGKVASAFVKNSVEGPVTVGRSGLPGDEQADLRVHGGPDMAIYVYPREHYSLWCAEFPEHSALWRAGGLGENLSLHGWDETVVCIGDTVRLGSTLLQVTRPRKPCFKLALRFNDLRLPRRLVETGRCGWYFRVLETGVIAPGDDLELVDRTHPAWTIRRVNDISVCPNPDTGELAELAAIPSLAANWRMQVSAALAAAKAADRTNSFREFKVTSTKDESASIRSFLLEPVGEGGVPPMIAGQHVVVCANADGSGQRASRPYSLSSISSTQLQISVKREAGGFSEWLHENVGVGYRLGLLGPRGSFVLDSTSAAPLTLISAGVGITPMMAMLQAATTNNGSRSVPSSITFIHGARNSADQAFAAQIDDIVSRHPTVRRHIRFSRPLQGDEIGRSHDSIGRVDRRLLETFLAGLDGSRVYVCGPSDFMSDVRRWIGELGLRGARIFAETFKLPVSAVRKAGVPPRAEATISFSRAGGQAKWERGMSLLEVVEATGIAVKSDCRSGVCGACATRVVSGGVGYDIEPLAEIAEGEVLLCCAHPLDGEVGLEI